MMTRVMLERIPWNKGRKMNEDFSITRSEVQRQLWLDPAYHEHMIAIHTGKRYPSASLKKTG
jgi:hypothetical protein